MSDTSSGMPQAHSNESNFALIRDGVASYLTDADPEETKEWLKSLDGLLEEAGPEHARFLMLRLLERATAKRVALPPLTSADLVNTIPTEIELEFPGDEDIKRRYCKRIRWNAAIMVHRTRRSGIGVGGHISTYAGATPLYEVGFNHFFHGKDHPGGGDHIFFQGHVSPGMYARAFLEERLTGEDLGGFRQEVSLDRGNGLPSCPRPHGMPEFWEFPTVSMGLGLLDAIYQARFSHYLHDCGIRDTSQQYVWTFLGDGEMDEPESRGAIQRATLNNLDNLTLVISCSLQRLNGPVHGNTSIIQELESFFHGAGWNAIEVAWSRERNEFFAKDKDGVLVDLMNKFCDDDYQTLRANNGAWVREYFFGCDPRTVKLVEDMIDEEIWNLRRDGHDYRKIYAAYRKTLGTKDQPTVILAHTIRGHGLDHNFEGRNATHQMRKSTLDDLKLFRDNQRTPISDEELEKDPYLPPYYNPGPDSEGVQHMLERREELGGFVPERRTSYEPLTVPKPENLRNLLKGSGKQKVATIMATVRVFRDLMHDKDLKDRFVPIIPDEARTFGTDSWFPTLKIYNLHDQNYTPVNHELMLSCKEAKDGQILHEGISKAGSTGSFTAVGSVYATHGVAMIPLYIFYSMFGFQRTADSTWVAGDQMSRGFLLGATAGRTTLTGEGLQHMDGHSQLLAATNPFVISYNPAFAYEIAYIVYDGIDRMYGPERGEDVIYCLTIYNEPTSQPAVSEDLDVEGLLGGIYRFRKVEGDKHVDLLASGIGMQEALRAVDILEDYGMASPIYSVTSWNELAHDGHGRDTERLHNPTKEVEDAFVTCQLSDTDGPFITVTDFQRAVSEQIREWVPGDYTVLGTDGYGFSDIRPAARRYLDSGGESAAVVALAALAHAGKLDMNVAQEAAGELQVTDSTAITQDAE